MKTTRLIPGSVCLKVIASILIVFTVLGHSFSQECINCNPDSLSGLYPSVMGSNTQALGNYSFAGGFYSQAKGSLSFAFGNRAIVDGSHSAALGMFVRTIGSSVMVFGNGFSIDEPLVNDTYGSLMIGFGSTKPTFFVGPSIGANNTGKVGIGNVTDPQAKLHIRADHGFIPEHATLRLEATAANTYARIYFGDAHHITAANQQNMKFSLPADRSFLFENGNVAIGTDAPEAKLHVNGDFQVGDVENPQEIRLYGSINAEGEYATAFGYDNAASGNFSFAGGELSEASGRSSFSFGQGNTVFHNYSFALGRFLEVHGSSSYAIGRYLKTLNPESMVIGYGFSDTQTLNNNIPRSLMIGFESTKPTFFVGPSNGANNTGKVGIGNVTDPQAKLHIRADDGMIPEHATLRLEATAANTYARIYLGDAHHITAANQQNMKFSLPADRSFIFENGSVGIGTDTPEAKLHISGGDVYLEDINFGIIMKSPNGHCWRGVMTDNGTLSFSQANCPGEASSVQNLPVEEGKLKAWPNPTNGNLIIESELYGSNTEILISTMEGKMMLRQMIISARTEVSLKSFTPGTYILQLLSNGQLVESRKIVKN